jgi:hypothetical protein
LLRAPRRCSAGRGLPAGAYGSIRVLNATPDEVSSGIDLFYV